MYLGRNGMRAGRKQLRDAGRLESSLGEPESSPQASPASPDDYRVILVIDDRVRRFLQSINPSESCVYVRHGWCTPVLERIEPTTKKKNKQCLQEVRE